MSFHEKPLAELYEESPVFYTGDSVIRAYTAPSDTEPSWAIRQCLYYPQYTSQNHQDHLQALQQSGVNVPELRIEDEYIATAWVQASKGPTSLLLEPAYHTACNNVFDGLAGYYEWARVAGNVILHDVFGLQQFIFGTTAADSKAAKLWLVDIDTVICPIERFPSPVRTMRDTLRLFTDIESTRADPRIS